MADIGVNDVWKTLFDTIISAVQFLANSSYSKNRSAFNETSSVPELLEAVLADSSGDVNSSFLEETLLPIAFLAFAQVFIHFFSLILII